MPSNDQSQSLARKACFKFNNKHEVSIHNIILQFNLTYKLHSIYIVTLYILTFNVYKLFVPYKNYLICLIHFKEARRRRNAASVELRKAKKDDQLSKRRNLNCEEEESTVQLEAGDNLMLSLDDLILHIKSPNENMRLLATQTCRKMLSREKNPPINDMIEAGIVPCCIELLDYDHKYVCI